MIKSEIWDSAVHVWKIAGDELMKMKDLIDKEAFINTVKMISTCEGRIITCGAGTSGAAAKKIAHSLSCIECPSFYLNPADALHGALGSVRKGDIALLISKGGGTHEIINIIPSLKEKKISIIGITENPESELGLNSDILITVKVQKEADSMNMLATTSTMAVIVLFDAVCIALMKEMNYTREQFALIHPGGDVGKRLLEGLE